jgi:hypothetical protein
LRQRIDPYKRRKDLGYWEEDQPAWDVSAHVNEPEVGRWAKNKGLCLSSIAAAVESITAFRGVVRNMHYQLSAESIQLGMVSRI